MLLNYQRPLEMARLIGALRGQSVPVRIILIDNAKEQHPLRDHVDRYVHVPWNGGCFMRMHVAHFADTEWVMYVDDDRRPRDEHFVRDALAIAREHPGAITGAHGRWLSREEPHYHHDTYGQVHIIQGFCAFFERKLLAGVPVTPPFEGEKALIERCDDIHLSLMSGKGQPAHWADPKIHESCLDDTKEGVGYSFDPRHAALRERIARNYLRHFGELPS